MAAAIEEKLGAPVELIRGKSGVFDVRYGDTLVFSKHAEGRFPEEEEVIEGLRRVMQAS